MTPQSAQGRHRYCLEPSQQQGENSTRDRVRKQNMTLHHEEHSRLRKKSSEVNTTNRYCFPPASVKFYASENPTEFADQQLQQQQGSVRTTGAGAAGETGSVVLQLMVDLATALLWGLDGLRSSWENVPHHSTNLVCTWD